MKKLLVTIDCSDRTGLIAAVTGHLFDLGADLGETAFAAVAGRAEFRTECEVASDVEAAALQAELAALPVLAGASVRVESAGDAPADHATHRIVVAGGDRPGLIARLSEAFVQYDANILRLDAGRIPGPGGARYVTRFAVKIPERSAHACLATVANTAGELGLTCHWEEASA
jgi:glycine cleavage system transcriptional repressor